jgi:hypothetical protein
MPINRQCLPECLGDVTQAFSTFRNILFNAKSPTDWDNRSTLFNIAGELFQHPATSTARFITFLALQGLTKMLPPAFLC